MEDDVLTVCWHMYSQLLECCITWQYVFESLDAVTCLNMVLIGLYDDAKCEGQTVRFLCQRRGWNDKAKWFDHTLDRGMEGNENMLALDNIVLLICKFVFCSGI